MITVTACVLLVLGALVILANWSLVVQRLAAGHSSSWIPLVGGILGFAGCALLPAVGWKLGSIAIVVDPGCTGLFVALLASGPVHWLRSRRRTE